MTIFLALLSRLVPTAHAVTLNQTGTAVNDSIAQMWLTICNTLPFCGVGIDAPRLFACKIGRFIFGSLSGVAVGIVIYAAIRMMLSEGDESAIAESKKMIAYAAGGMVLSMVAWALVPFVASVIASLFGDAAWQVIPLQCTY